MAVTDTAKISEAGELLKKQYRKLKEISGLYEKAERLLRSRGDGEDPLQMSQRTRELLEEELMRFSAYISFTEEIFLNPSVRTAVTGLPLYALGRLTISGSSAPSFTVMP